MRDNHGMLIFRRHAAALPSSCKSSLIHKMGRDNISPQLFSYSALHFWKTMTNHHCSHPSDWIFFPHNVSVTFRFGISVSSQKGGIRQSSFMQCVLVLQSAHCFEMLRQLVCWFKQKKGLFGQQRLARPASSGWFMDVIMSSSYIKVQHPIALCFLHLPIEFKQHCTRKIASILLKTDCSYCMMTKATRAPLSLSLPSSKVPQYLKEKCTSEVQWWELVL